MLYYEGGQQYPINATLCPQIERKYLAFRPKKFYSFHFI